LTAGFAAGIELRAIQVQRLQGPEMCIDKSMCSMHADRFLPPPLRWMFSIFSGCTAFRAEKNAKLASGRASDSAQRCNLYLSKTFIRRLRKATHHFAENSTSNHKLTINLFPHSIFTQTQTFLLPNTAH
jgi:hypothetical protein